MRSPTPWGFRIAASVNAGVDIANSIFNTEVKHSDHRPNGVIYAPDQVIASLRTILEETRPSILALWGNDGKVNHDDSMDCIRLMGQEVMPALREIGDELGLNSPFDLDTPVSLAQTPPGELKPVAA